MLRTTLRVISYALLFCTATTLRAQTSTIQPRFALEIQGPPGFVTQFLIIQEGQGVQRTVLSFGPSLPRLDGLKAANDESGQGSAIELDYKLNGDVVAIAFGGFRTSRRKRPKWITGRRFYAIDRYLLGTPSRVDRLGQNGRFGIAAVDHHGCHGAIATPNESGECEQSLVNSS